MKHNVIFLFFTSLACYLFSATVFAQETVDQDTVEIEVQDTLEAKEKFGIRVGIDLSKLARSFFQEDYEGLELVGDYRVYDNFYAAAEIGSESLPFKEDNLKVTATGQYAKIGVDYNAYENWAGMENMVYVGLRYGFSTFSQDLEEYQIYSTNQFFGPDIREEGREYSGLTANWIELVAGLKVEVLNNLYLSLNVQLKRRLFQTAPDDFDNLTIPGFNRTYDGSNIGVGYGYTISYLIPFYKK